MVRCGRGRPLLSPDVIWAGSWFGDREMTQMQPTPEEVVQAVKAYNERYAVMDEAIWRRSQRRASMTLCLPFKRMTTCSMEAVS
jgi:hypothetical protein